MSRASSYSQGCSSPTAMPAMGWLSKSVDGAERFGEICKEEWLSKSFAGTGASLEQKGCAAPPCYPPGLEKKDVHLINAQALAARPGRPSMLQKGDDLALIGLPPGLEICGGTLESGPLSTSTASGSASKHILDDSEDGDSLSQESLVSPTESPSMASSRDGLVCHLASMFSTTPPAEWEQAAVDTARTHQAWGLAPGPYEGWHYGGTSAYQAWDHVGGSSAPKKFCAFCGGERKAHYVFCPHCSQKL